MQDSPSLWQCLHYCGTSRRQQTRVAELRWLARRPGPVVEALLYFNSVYETQELPLAFACLGQWASTLQSLCVKASSLPSLSFLGALSQLTQLAVEVTVLESESPRHGERKAPCLHQKLRSLSWVVSYESEVGDRDHHLPTLTTSLQHLEVSVGPGAVALPQELSQLRLLQSLQVGALLADEPTALSLLGAQTSLSYLSFKQCGLEVLPPGLSLLTALRCLIASECQFGYTNEGMQSLQAIQHLPHLEFLDVSYCRLMELPQLNWPKDPPPLRVLLVQGNACPLDQSWLAHVKRLACGWHQVCCHDERLCAFGEENCGYSSLRVEDLLHPSGCRLQQQPSAFA